MCVAFFTLDHPDYALILCSNRDEYLARPTLPASFHAFGAQREPDVLSGVDAQGGGSWLGLGRSGKFALLTNITESHDTYVSSRGHLVASFLTSPFPSSYSLEDDARRIVPPDGRYAGFNLVLLAPTTTTPHRTSPPLALDALFVTNHGGGGPITYRTLSDTERHRTALSNGVDGSASADDDWPKVTHGVRAFDDLLDALPPDTPDERLAERLFDLLTWRSARPPRDRSELRHTVHVDPFTIGDGGLYGTRLSTVVLVKRSGQVLFTERDVWMLSAHGRPMLADPASQRVFRFTIELSG